MFEIGSEFWTEGEQKGKGLKSLVPKNTNVIYTLCGRTALDIVIKDILSERNVRSVYMPSYCCHTMIEPFLRNCVEVVFYDVVTTDAGIKSKLEQNDCDIVFLIDYFGFIDSEIGKFATEERTKGKTIIYDATHSMLCSNIDYSVYDYVYGSFRKWVGINAGFAAKHGEWVREPELINNKEYSRLRNDAFDLKAEYMLNPDKVKKDDFLSTFRMAEEMLEIDYQNYAPDARSNDLLKRMDTDRIRKVRRKNAKLLLNGLKNCKRVFLPYDSIKQEECPLFVPIMIKNERNALREYLIERHIYLPIHWPISPLHRLEMNNRFVYDEEMSCVCDQRYSERDMEHIVKVIKQFK